MSDGLTGGGSMFIDRFFAGFRARVRTIALLAISGILVSLLGGCGGDASGSGCLIFNPGVVIDFNEDVTGGFDDFRSAGAALGVAIDERDPNMSLIIATRFSSQTVEEFYSPTCDTAAAIESYDFAELNNVTAPLAIAYPFITPGLTDTNGIEGMSHRMNAFLFIDDDDGLRFFIAVEGNIVLQRDLAVASSARIRGDLTFVELTAGSAVAEVLDGGAVLRIEDIDISWDADIQPTD